MELVDISLSHFLKDSPKIAIPMYVYMHVLIHCPRVRVHILQLGKDYQRRSRVNSNCSSPKQEPVPELNGSIHSQQGIAGRD